MGTGVGTRIGAEIVTWAEMEIRTGTGTGRKIKRDMETRFKVLAGYKLQLGHVMYCSWVKIPHFNSLYYKDCDQNHFMDTD